MKGCYVIISEPLIGLWWYTNKNDLLGLRHPLHVGVDLNVWRTSPYLHTQAWELALPHNSEYYGKDSNNFIYGWVNYNNANYRYYILSDNDIITQDETLQAAIIREFHLDVSRCIFEKHKSPV